MSTTTWQDNADEFGRLTRQGKDVRLALLVACSVEKGSGGPRLTGSFDPVSGKTSARLFAEQAGVYDHKRVLRHLAAWDTFAQAQGLPRSADLTPADASTLEVTEEQAAAFRQIPITPPQKTVEQVKAVRTSEGTRILGPAEATLHKIVGQKPTRSEREAFTTKIKALHVDRQWPVAQIAEHAGESTSLITRYLKAAGVQIQRHRRKDETADPVSLMYGYEPGQRPDQVSVTKVETNSRQGFVVSTYLDWLISQRRHESDARSDLNAFAHAAREAFGAQDYKWIEDARALLLWGRTRLEDFTRVLDDPQFLAECLDYRRDPHRVWTDEQMEALRKKHNPE